MLQSKCAQGWLAQRPSPIQSTPRPASRGLGSHIRQHNWQLRAAAEGTAATEAPKKAKPQKQQARLARTSVFLMMLVG
eukprot:1162142-Pelagomonas_calceolata.AAC.5